MIKKHIPNAITCANLFSGCIVIVYAFNGDLKTVAWFVILSGIFDFFDGLVARWLNVKSAIGKELDSLADVISFGFLPGVVLFQMLNNVEAAGYLPYFAFLIPVFSALRLAKFNVDTRQAEDFIGLNTPMNTFIIISLPYLAEDFLFVGSSYFLLPLICLSCFLLISEISFFSFKLSDTSWATNRFRFLFLLVALILLFVFQLSAFPFIFVAYWIFSILHYNAKS